MAEASNKKIVGDAKVAGFQTKIRALRSKIFALQNSKGSLYAQREATINALADANELFKAELQSDFPEVEVSELLKTLPTAKSTSPIYIKWMKHQPTVLGLEKKILSLEAEIKKIDKSEVTIGTDMLMSFAEYEQFFKNNQELQLESPALFNQTMLAESYLPRAEEDTLIADLDDLTGGAIVNSEADAIVTTYEADKTLVPMSAEAKSKLIKYALIGGGLFLFFS